METIVVSVDQELQGMVKDGSSKMPQVIADILSPFRSQLGELKVIHPTTNDPVLVSSTMGVVAIWIEF